MTYEEKAKELKASGVNCCQAVLGCCSEEFGLSEDMACRLGAFFGGGMRQGEVCGAVTGALMALGLQYGDENNRTSKKSLEFLKKFREDHGSLLCRELIPDEGKKSELCPVLIAYCAKYLEKEFAE